MVRVLSLSDMDLSTHALTAYQFLTNSECYIMLISSEGMGAKVHVREGNNPDHQLRSLNIY